MGHTLARSTRGQTKAKRRMIVDAVTSHFIVIQCTGETKDTDE